MGSLPGVGDDAFDRAPASMAIIDATDGTVLRANQALARRLGMEPSRLEGLAWPSPLGGSRNDFAALREQVVGRELAVVENRMGDRIDPVWWRQTIVRIDPPDASAYLIVQVEDRTREHRITHDLTRAADHDELTGLWNRRRFRRELRVALDSGDHRVGLVLFDVDGFKEVNDSYGHSVGDAALAAVAAALCSAAPERSGVARLSGDEFAVLVRAESVEQVIDRCARLARLTRRVVVGESVPEIELSAGWAVGTPGPEPDRRVHNLMIEADVAMYATKARARAERNVVFGPDADEVPVATVWTSDGVVQETGFELWSHPVVEVVSGRDALHDITLRGPKAPITLGALVRILEMIERHAGRLVGRPARYLVHLHDFPLGVGSAVKWLGQTAADAGLAPGSVTFALPESRLLDEGRSAHLALSSLREEGFGLAVDAFGAEVGSLRLLTNLVPDQVWLDRRLIAVSAPSPIPAGVDLAEVTVALAQRIRALTGVSGVGTDDLGLVGAVGIDLALVPDSSALRPVGVVAVEASVRPVSVEADRPPAASSTTGS